MPQSATPRLRTPRTLLRSFKQSDIAYRAACRDDPEIVRMFGGSVGGESKAMTVQEAEGWFEHVYTDGSATHWAIEFDGRFIGTARLHSANLTDRGARYAVGILDRSVLGIGLGSEVTKAMLKHGFETLHLHRIDLRVLEYNEQAIRCYRRCGFIEEGRERDSALVSGHWHDDIAMSILEHERNATITSH